MTTWTQIASLDSPTAGVFDFPSVTWTGYIQFEVIISGVTVTSDDTSLILQFYKSSALVTGASYRWDLQAATNAATTHDGNNSVTAIGLTSNNANEGVGNATGEAFGGVVILDNPLSAALTHKVEHEVAFTNPAGSINAGNGMGCLDGTGVALDGFRISGSSNLTAGKVRVLGLA